ncbi:GNAT family N-acetyltransferase [Haloarchaeobius sp. HRN-SO-5]|uniref:GNAT family N-acetyltransferase n=1 Tax=Haloarchaeobius sp. HRN-SO-5 TaxID=3446118 RepID=UPI003EBA4016
MYHRILVPTDGSAGSNEALRRGIDLAQKYGATIHLVYVVDEDIFGQYGGIDAIEHVEEALEEAGDDVLKTARERVEASSLPVEVHVAHTTPHQGIVDSVRRVGADLVVMGTERRSDEYRHLLGSVTERVVRTSPVPVHVVKAETGEGADLTVRPASESDGHDVREIARRSMTASYGDLLTETEIDDAVAEWYSSGSFEELLSDQQAVVLVAEKGGAVVGFSESYLVDAPAGMTGEIHWLHVDPGHRRNGIGTELFDRTRAVLADHDAERTRALVLSDYEGGNAFYRTCGLTRTASRPVPVGGTSVEENVYTEPVPAGERPRPQVESRTTADGETLFVDFEESELGSEGPFFAAYATRDREDRYGWFCSNCETFDNAMDSMGRIVCNQCGNHHKATRWDAVVSE